MSSIFISYSPEDSKYVYKLGGALEYVGFSFWLDERIGFDKQWPPEVQEELQKSEAFILIMTPYSQAARWVEKELDYAKEQNKAIFPLWLGGSGWQSLNAVPYIVDVRDGKLPGTSFFERLGEIVGRNIPDGQETLTQATRHLRVIRQFVLGGTTRQIEPGDYTLNDPRLYGAAHTLVKAGQAVWLDITGPRLLRVTMGYQGDYSKDQYIAPGEYEKDDPRLHGLAAFLLEIDRAAWIPSNVVPDGPLKTPDKSLVLPMLEWCDIPAGEVTLNSLLHGSITYKVEAFKISKYAVTNEQYEVFQTDQEGYANEKWWNYSPQAFEWRSTHPQPIFSYFRGNKRPRVNVCWYEALAFCRWLSYKTGQSIFLPSEQQWQRAAQGDDEEQQFPWGNQFEATRCNTSESGLGKTVEVDAYPNGVSPYGVYNMSGNTWEWCFTKYESEDNSDATGAEIRAEHGGSWNFAWQQARVMNRVHYTPFSRDDNVGFRVVRLDPL
jgi:hypothetical protein